MTSNQSSVSSETRLLRRVTFVGQCADQFFFDAVLAAFEHDVVSFEPVSEAYSRIKRVAPDVVVLCLSSDDVEGCRVLSMLALDSDTSQIPVLTYLTPDCCGAVHDGASFTPERETFSRYGSIPLN